MKALETRSDQELSKEDVRVKMEDQPKSSSSLPRPPGPVLSNLVAQAAYGLGFGRTTYSWKYKIITDPMALVSCHLDFGVHGKLRRKLAVRFCQGAASPILGPLGHVSS